MKSHEIEFDVIVPIFRSADYLERALDSIYKQTHENWTCYIIDGDYQEGSNDLSIVKKYVALDERFVYLVQESKEYPYLSGARNQAILAGSGEHIALLDSDDIWYAEHLAEHAAVWATNPASSLVFTVGEYDQGYHWEKSGEHFMRRYTMSVLQEKPPKGAEWLLATHCPSLVLVPSIVSFTRKMYDRVGGFPPVKFEEDVALFSLLLKEGGFQEGGDPVQIPFVGAWLDWLRDGDKVSRTMHTTGQERLFTDRKFYSMRWFGWATDLLHEQPEGFTGTVWEEWCKRIVAGVWPW